MRSRVGLVERRSPIIWLTLAIAACASFALVTTVRAQPAAAHEVAQDPTDELGIITGGNYLRQHTLGPDVMEVWICELANPGTKQKFELSPEAVATALNAELPPYFNWASNGRKSLSFIPGGEVVIPGPDTDVEECFNAVTAVAAGDGVSSNGAVMAFDVATNEAAGGPGNGPSFPANARVAFYGANHVQPGFISNLDRAFLVHEIGHTMEMPHSYTGQTTIEGSVWEYDDIIEVMSGADSMVGTMALNRYAAGWIDADQVVVYDQAAIEVGLGPVGYPGPQLIVVPGPDPHTFAVIDTRVLKSFDSGLAAEGVTVHTMDERASACGTTEFPHCFGAERLVRPFESFPYSTQHVHGVDDSFSVYGIDVTVTDRVGDVFTVTVGDLPLGFPAGARLQLNALTETAMTISWPAAFSAEDYEVTGAGVEFVTDRSTTLTGLTPGTTYVMEVVARKGGERTDPLTLSVTTVAEGGSRVGRQNPATGFWSLVRNDATTNGFYYGTPGDLAVACDWNGDGIDTVGLYRPGDGFLYLRNSNTQGPGETEIFYGEPSDIPVCGDWDGDGIETVGVYRPRNATFYLRNSNTQGFADVQFIFGNPGDIPFAGDWDGDGIDTVGLYRQSTGFVYITDENAFGIADFEAFYGNPGDRFVVGDWDGNGRDSFGIFRPSDTTFYLSNAIGDAIADIEIVTGTPATVPIAGRWD